MPVCVRDRRYSSAVCRRLHGTQTNLSLCRSGFGVEMLRFQESKSQCGHCFRRRIIRWQSVELSARRSPSPPAIISLQANTNAKNIFIRWQRMRKWQLPAFEVAADIGPNATLLCRSRQRRCDRTASQFAAGMVTPQATSSIAQILISQPGPRANLRFRIVSSIYCRWQLFVNRINSNAHTNCVPNAILRHSSSRAFSMLVRSPCLWKTSEQWLFLHILHCQFHPNGFYCALRCHTNAIAATVRTMCTAEEST